MIQKAIVVLVLLTCVVTGRAQQEVIYHVFQRSFFDSNGDGNGDLEGIRQKLDYLQELGVTSILMTPLYVSDFYHNYFADDDFKKIDPSYGSLANYLRLVKEVHQRKMKIYQDVEMQYVAGRHPWFTGSYQNPASPFSNYLVYNDNQNKQPFWFWGIPEFTLYNNVKQKVIVVNMNDPAVKEYTYQTLAYWTDPNKDGRFEDGVDGFRLDHMMEDLDNAGKLPHLFSNFWTPLLTRLREVNPALRIVAEQANWFSYGYEYFDQGHTDRVFAFRLMMAIESFDKQKILAAADSTFRHTPAGKQQVVFIENHDTRRFASLPGMNAGKLKIGAALNILMGGIPSIYYGQELGMEGTRLNGPTDGNDIPIREAFDWYKNASGKGMALWYKNTGPWWDQRNTQPDDGISLEEERQDPGSLWNYYKQLLTLKRSHQALSGTYQPLDNDNSNVFSFLRAFGKEQIVVVVNLSAQEQQAVVQVNSPVTKIVNLLETVSPKADKNKLVVTLPGYTVQVWKLN